MEAVDVLRVAEVRSAYGVGQGIFGLRGRDDVNVIGHETIADDVQAVFGGLVGEQLQIYMPIIIDKEYILFIITSLGYMMRYLRDYDSRFSWHEHKYRIMKQYVKKK